MLPATAILLVVVLSVVSCQIDGEFWWLNNDVSKLRHGTAPPPQFDDVNELDTDETAKIIFRDEIKSGKSLKNDKEMLNIIHFRDESELAKPMFEKEQLKDNNKLSKYPLKQIDSDNSSSSQASNDEFRFVFPSDDNLLLAGNKHIIKNQNTLPTEFKTEFPRKRNSVPKSIDEAWPQSDNNMLVPENICSFITKSECIRNDGTLYEPWMNSNIPVNIPNTQIVCCILPITTTSVVKVVFPTSYWTAKRHKRSNVDDTSPALKQRNILINRKYSLDNQKIKVNTPAARKNINHKVLNSDEYSIDPYWNIKNINIRNLNTPSYQDPDSGYDYGSQSYGDDYAVELPKPGLVGLYSDHKQSQSSWTNNKNKVFSYDTPDSVEEDNFETSFGYSTIDPRQDHRLTSKPSKHIRRRPLKLSSAYSTVDEASSINPTISFHSNPDFELLQGFKLLNLMRLRNRHVRTTSDDDKEFPNKLTDQQKPPNYTNYFGDNDLSTPNVKQKQFNDCGKTTRKCPSCESGQQGVVEYGDHPWIVLVVSTKSEHTILCYATLLHSRVVVTVADCVHGKGPGEVSIIAGVRNLNADIAQSQRRMATITLDPDYTPNGIDHSLALLHWLRPLTLNAKVQPACLAEAHVDDSCVFVGWDGYDKEMRWQRASILATQNCIERLSELEVSDAFCATVESRGTVTSVGAPLLCEYGDRWSAVGVAVWRDDVVIVLHLREWHIRTMLSLRIK